MINEETFASRLTSLREQKKVSAREMSLDLGQNGSYINRIENRKAFPSMQCFFYICDYLQISPAAFYFLLFFLMIPPKPHMHWIHLPNC